MNMATKRTLETDDSAPLCPGKGRGPCKYDGTLKTKKNGTTNKLCDRCRGPGYAAARKDTKPAGDPRHIISVNETFNLPPTPIYVSPYYLDHIYTICNAAKREDLVAFVKELRLPKLDKDPNAVKLLSRPDYIRLYREGMHQFYVELLDGKLGDAKKLFFSLIKHCKRLDATGKSIPPQLPAPRGYILSEEDSRARELFSHRTFGIPMPVKPTPSPYNIASRTVEFRIAKLYQREDFTLALSTNRCNPNAWLEEARSLVPTHLRQHITLELMRYLRKLAMRVTTEEIAEERQRRRIKMEQRVEVEQRIKIEAAKGGEDDEDMTDESR
ncbi:hypothetical protein NX059_004039 [Plenodomus lindquistii]|nr:hypothetical protein NX059_004039 [Plenodomus lindquistii]